MIKKKIALSDSVRKMIFHSTQGRVGFADTKGQKDFLETIGMEPMDGEDITNKDTGGSSPAMGEVPVPEPVVEEMAVEEAPVVDELDTILEDIKAIIEAEGVDKEVEKMGKELTAQLEELRQAKKNAMEFIDKNKGGGETPEVPAPEAEATPMEPPVPA